MAQLEKPNDNHTGYIALGGSVVIVGTVFVILRTLFPILPILVPTLIGGWIWQRSRRLYKLQQSSLDTAFYQLLQDYEGRMTLLDLAMSTKLPAIVVQQYLDTQVREFAAQLEVTAAGEIVYVFSTLKAIQLPALVQPSDSANPVSQTDREKVKPLLTQAELAKRLGTSASTISRKKLSADLTVWSKTKDPDGWGWAYLVQVQRFTPVE